MPQKHLMSGSRPQWGWLPSVCQICGVWPASPLGEPVCGACLTASAPPAERCATCGLALGPTTLCGECLQRPSPLASCVAAVDYGYPWDVPMARFKFHGDTAWARWFAGLMAHAPGASETMGRCDIFVPLPLTPKRLGERGYNQAWLLAKRLTAHAPEHRHKLRADALAKLRDTAVQHGLDRAARLTNLRAAFAVPPQAIQAVAGQRVLLVDDIMTTGATLHAAAHALTMAGATEVSALVFARTPRE